jgi:hypothetical protein
MGGKGYAPFCGLSLPAFLVTVSLALRLCMLDAYGLVLAYDCL